MIKYGLIGFPLTHSFSKEFFTEKFTREKTCATYENFEIENISKLPEVIKNNPKLAGLNITIPYKEQVVPFLNEIDEAVKKIGAVNTIKITHKTGKPYLKGFNTDIWGFEISLKPLLREFHSKALILGTGGASKAIKYILNKLEIDYISASIEELKKGEISYQDIDKQIISERLLIINATPLGTYPETETFPPIPYEYISDKHLLYDLVYNPEMTIFLKKGKEKGAVVKNGLEMLQQQALRSYVIWTG